ncbi:hypothetical protein ABZT34_37280 [Streptomyces sp. NPDC005329]
MVDIPIMDDLAAFTGDFALGVDRARVLDRTFIRTRATSHLGE